MDDFLHMNKTMDIILEAALRMARDAGDLQLTYFRNNNFRIDSKFNDSDIVTTADKESERLIISRIHELFPGHAILSEESGDDCVSSDWRWVVDPLDGTTNFSQGLPLFSVSIGIEYKRETVAGVVHAPYLGETFRAVRGEGAYMNGKRIRCGVKNNLSESVLATGFPVDKDRNPDNNLDNLARLLPQIRGIRRLGSAAIDLCYVASGILDGYWEMNLHPWDVSAGMLIAREAGAVVESFRKDRNISIVASGSGLFETLKTQIR